VLAECVIDPTNTTWKRNIEHVESTFCCVLTCCRAVKKQGAGSDRNWEREEEEATGRTGGPDGDGGAQ